MKGKYHIIVQNNRIKFEFDIKRNITIIRGDSATGKTTLLSMIDTHDRLGDESGVSVVCDRRCLTVTNSNWEAVIGSVSKCIIFIDEENTVIKTYEFAEKIRSSDNYYVLITRENLPSLPYSAEEIYGIHVSGKYADLRQTYNSFYRLYNYENDGKHLPAKAIIVEDSNSGYEFFNSITQGSAHCISAEGKSKIIHMLPNYIGQNVLVIADGAAFGPEMGEIFLYMQQHPDVSLYLPESFEWIILSSGLIDGNRIRNILDHPEDHIESSEYFSWERYFTHILVEETKNSYLQYSKVRLNTAYLNKKHRSAIIDAMEVIGKQLSGSITAL